MNNNYKVFRSAWLVPDFKTLYNYMTYRIGNGFSTVHSVNW